MSFFRRAKLEESDHIKEKYGYGSIYLTSILGKKLRPHFEKLLNLQTPKEVLIISVGDIDLSDQLAVVSSNNVINKVYILHSLLPPVDNDPFFIMGLAAPLTIMQALAPRTSEQEMELRCKRERISEEWYEEAGKTTLGEVISVTHRICMAIDLDAKKVDYKDSYGREIPNELREMVVKTCAIPAANVKSHTGRQQHAEDHSNCALLSLENLKSFKENKSFVDLGTNYIAQMQKIRKKYGDYLASELEQFLTQNKLSHVKAAAKASEMKEENLPQGYVYVYYV